MLQNVKNIYHLLIALSANLWFGFPSRKATVIGVTGTDGKTTTTSLIYHILKECGLKASMISSIGAVIDSKRYSLPFHVTTLPPFALQKFIKMAVSGSKANNGKKYVVLEVTSHALDQFRVLGTSFDIGVITNVSYEHLDYHKNYKEYANTKLKLLKSSKIAVLNKDDKSFKLMSPQLKQIIGRNFRLVTYGLGSSSDVNPENFPFESKLVGEFNKYNVLAAATAVRLLGISNSRIRRAISTFEAPVGRQDIVFKKDFTVMIDFAHTPNSFKEILSALKPSVKGRLIHVFGSAGERDRQKRPQMGKISSEYSDILVITAEDPRSESIESITEDIIRGVKDKDARLEKNSIVRIADRQEAINHAVRMAKKDDLIIITGKAHEKSMNYGKGEIPWDDYKAVSKALKLLHEKN